MTKPVLLDLFCGAGGCAKGYQRAGFYVVGVDNRPQPRYCGDEFYLADALEFVREHGREFDVIHASPPCQDFCAMKHFPGMEQRGDLITPLRPLLLATGSVYVIENVPRAPLRSPVLLCGAQLALKVYRHRAFESNAMLFARPHIPHRDNCRKRILSRCGFVTVAGDGGMGMGPGGMEYARRAMAIDWMTRAELSQAIPPAYTEFIGRQLLAHVGNRS